MGPEWDWLELEPFYGAKTVSEVANSAAGAPPGNGDPL